MSKRIYDEERIEELLQQLPIVEDNRSADEIFARISKTMEDEESSNSDMSTPIVKRSKWVLPVLGSVAAVVLFIVMLPVILNNGSEMSIEKEESSEKAIFENHANLQGQSEEGFAGDQVQSFSESISKKMIVIEPLSHTINEINADEQLLVGALVNDSFQYTIPVSKTIPKNIPLDEALNSFIQDELSNMSIYSADFWKNITFEQLNEHTMEVNLFGEQSMLINNEKSVEVAFISMLKEMMLPIGISELKFSHNETAGIEFSKMGYVESLIIEREQKIYYLTEGEHKYLVPIPTTASDLQSAFQQMLTDDDNKQLYSPFLNGIQVESVELNDKHIQIQLMNTNDLVNNEESIYMIEAILLTAKSYGYDTVQFENLPFNQYGPYNVSQPITVPYSANRL
ncbi:GerMN domain-containing protein [Bacillus solimangrovi]|uniref:GerMN domain-containing protein n=1 Tax=Bacillus solimangrovi TaxID=1305675 RepID=A0A1E5LHG2_9BACI|nr:GerMN domain-containing protein [Bacillus solimangrovi]OEH93508.1 hypothetical protein BFG57_00500 [Bacillus solimangrovi]